MKKLFALMAAMILLISGFGSAETSLVESEETMANIPQVNVGGTVYNLKDTEAREQISDLNSAFIDCQDIYLNRNINKSNLLNPNTCVFGGLYYSSNGAWYKDSNLWSTDLIELPGDLSSDNSHMLSITPTQTNVHVTYWDESNQFIGGEQTTHVYKKYQNAKYVRLGFHSAYNKPPKTSVQYGNAFVPYYTVIDEYLREDIERERNIYLTRDPYNSNVLNPYTAKRGHLYYSSTGLIYEDNKSWTSDWIELPDDLSSDVSHIWNIIPATVNYNITYWDSSKQFLGGENRSFIYKAFPNAKYVLIGGNYDYNNPQETYIGYETTFRPYYLPKIAQNESQHYGANCLMIGDSITYGSLADQYSYADYIHDVTVANVTKEAVEGSTLHTYVQRINDLPTGDFDVVTILLGTNDFNTDIDIGEPTTTNNNYFYGSVNLFITGLSQKYPNSTIIFMTPFYRKYTGDHEASYKGMTNGLGLTLYQYAEAIKSRCNEYNIPCLDLMKNSGFTDWNITQYTVDGLHPNANGHKKLATIVYNFIKKYFAY